MRSLFASSAAMALASMAVPVSGFPTDRFAGPGIAPLPERPRIKRAPGSKRERPRTLRGREDGKLMDPFHGLKSGGRRGAVERAGVMERALAKKNGQRVRAKVGRVFKSEARNAAFHGHLKAGLTHNQALKLARRVAA